MIGKIRRARICYYPILAFEPPLCANGPAVKYLLWPLFLLLTPAIMSQTTSSACHDNVDEIMAAPISHPLTLDAQHPAKDWDRASPITFCLDWAGKNADPQRQTTVRVLWSVEMLYLRFDCKYREITVFSDSDGDGRRDHLWDRDVAEAFLQPDPSKTHYYKEFEVAPNGFWIDLDISPQPLVDLKSGMKRSVWLDKSHQTWAAELAIPMKSLTGNFDHSATWRANFYRVEGVQEPRAYLAWRATKTPKPNFHVPAEFGNLRFAQK